jgi:hypothetical protein
MSEANPLAHRYDNWMKLNPGAERQDVTTDARGYIKCAHVETQGFDTEHIQCRRCYMLKEREVERI